MTLAAIEAVCATARAALPFVFADELPVIAPVPGSGPPAWTIYWQTTQTAGTIPVYGLALLDAGWTVRRVRNLDGIACYRLTWEADDHG